MRNSDDEDAQLQAALAMSLKAQAPQPAPASNVDLDMQLALTMSLQAGGASGADTAMDIVDDDDEDLRAALSLSMQSDGAAASAAVAVNDGDGNDTINSMDVSPAKAAAAAAANGGDTSTLEASPPGVQPGTITPEPGPTTTATAATTTAVDVVDEEDDRKPAAKPSPVAPLVATTSYDWLPAGPLSADVQAWYATAQPCDMHDFHNIMWDPVISTQNDRKRWVSQGINFRDHDPQQAQLDHVAAMDSMLAALITNHGPWGLTQAHGGPCGVLAAVQAEFLRLLLFGTTSNPSDDGPQFPDRLSNKRVLAKPDLSEPTVLRSMAMAIAVILARAALAPAASEATNDRPQQVRLVLPKSQTTSTASESLGMDAFAPWGTNASGSNLSATLMVYTVDLDTMEDTQNNSPSSAVAGTVVADAANPQSAAVSSAAPSPIASSPLLSQLDNQIFALARAVTKFLLQRPLVGRPPLDCFRQPGGVVLLVMSLATSRGAQLVQQDMDDTTARLTGRFGHCNQELINLLLTGQSVSNVFDNTLSPSEGITCRGVQMRPAIGYLTQLEAMRYVEVGGFYKSPRFPIWVVGSTSHFTVMFGDAIALKESKSDALLEKCRRAFKSIEGGEENGFIAATSLRQFFNSVDYGGITDSEIATLSATLEVPGAGIILWDDLWKHTSRLLMGASLRVVLQMTDTSGKAPQAQMKPAVNPASQAPAVKPAPVAAKPPAKTDAAETDEEMARRLAAELNGPQFVPAKVVATIPEAASAPKKDEGPLSDEDFARQLQQQWDQTAAATGMASSSTAAATMSKAEADDATIATTTSQQQAPLLLTNAPHDDDKSKKPLIQDYERSDRTIQLYHYNGLRGGTLHAFRVTRLSAEEAVGASIALGRGNSVAGETDLGDVVRTRWPSSVINWLGGSPPSIN